MRVPGRLAVATCLLLAVAACAKGTTPRASSSPAPLPTLPDGALRDEVLQPDEVSRAMVPLAAQTGPRDIAAIAAYSPNPVAAVKALRVHGFQTGYVVEYADPATSAVISNTVTKFATAEGATADLTADLASAEATGTPFPVTGLGDQAGGVRGKRTSTAADGTLVQLRWRVGDTTWLLVVGAGQPVDLDGARSLADAIVKRLASSS